MTYDIFLTWIIAGVFALLVTCFGFKYQGSFGHYSWWLSALLGIAITAILLIVAYFAKQFLHSTIIEKWGLLAQVFATIILYTVITSFFYITCGKMVDDALTKIEKRYVDNVLLEIEEKYIKTNIHKQHFFDVMFQLSSLGSTTYKYDKVKGMVFHKLLHWYGAKSQNEQKFYFPTGAYYDIVGQLIKDGYSMTSLNAAMIPYWYVPVGNYIILNDYMKILRDHKSQCKRITYYGDQFWETNTVRSIFKEIGSGQEGPATAWLWLRTALSKAQRFSPEKMGGICHHFTIAFPKLSITDVFFATNTIRNDAKTEMSVLIANGTLTWDKVKIFFDSILPSESEETSKIITKVFNEQFIRDFGENNYHRQGSEVAPAYVDLDKVVEVGCFEKNEHRFVFLISGFEKKVKGSCVEITIVEGDKAKEICAYFGEIARPPSPSTRSSTSVMPATPVAMPPMPETGESSNAS